MTPRRRSIFVGALVTGILGTSYFSLINLVCCLGVLIGGAVTVQQFTSRTGTAIESGDGAILGALAGAGGAILTAIFDWGLRPLNLDSQSVTQDMFSGLMQGMEGQGGFSPEMMQQMQGEQTIGAILVGLVVGIIVNAIFGAIGGAIGAAIFGEDAAGSGGMQTADAEITDA